MKPTSRTQPAYLPPTLEYCRAGRSRTTPLSRAWTALKAYGDRWMRRYRLRQSLREMDTYRVEKDIGVPVGTLWEESRKPFWRD